MAIRIALAENMDLALEGLKVILFRQTAFQIIGTYQLLSDLLSDLSTMQPQVILLGERLDPDLDLLSVVEQVHNAAPRAHIVVLSTLTDGLMLHALFQTGAAAYLYKNDPLSACLIEAIQAVTHGRPYLSPSANTEYLLAMRSGRADWDLDPEARDVLRLMAQGYRVQEIALMRGVSVRRVYSINEKLRRRFQAETNEHAIARAAQEGFLV